jgi:hypothetical protein
VVETTPDHGATSSSDISDTGSGSGQPCPRPPRQAEHPNRSRTLPGRAAPPLEQMDFLLFLTKFDLLDRKIGKSPLTPRDWFDDFTPLLSRKLINGSSSRNCAMLAQMADYMAVKLRRLFHSITAETLCILRERLGPGICQFGDPLWLGDCQVRKREACIFGSSETIYSEETSSYSH